MAKASDVEEEYFARENAERLRKLAAEQKKALADTVQRNPSSLVFGRAEAADR